MRNKEEIKQKVETHLGLSIDSITRIHEGVMNFTFDIVVNGENLILKVNPEGREEIAKKEHTVIEKCRERACKVPEETKPHSANTNDDFSFLVYKKLPGKSLSSYMGELSADEAANIISQVVENFKVISAIGLTGNGATNNLDDVGTKPWKEFLQKECKDGISFLRKKKLFASTQIANLESYLNKQIKQIEHSGNKLVWADFDYGNIIIDDNKNLSGFIDFEGVIGGDPAFAIGCLVAKHGYTDFSNQLISELNYSKDTIDFYAIVRYLRLIQYSEDLLPTGIQRDNINCFLPHANHLMLDRMNKDEEKWNRSRHKLLAAFVIAVLFAFCFFGFLRHFNMLYEIKKASFIITLKCTINNSSFFYLFGFLASLGGLVRVIFDFIGNTCYTGNFDFKKWWPLYIYRPLIAFILGSVLVLLFDNSLFGDDTTKELSKFPFILAFITGFAVSDAVNFLRDFSKRIFGLNNNVNRKEKE